MRISTFDPSKYQLDQNCNQRKTTLKTEVVLNSLLQKSKCVIIRNVIKMRGSDQNLNLELTQKQNILHKKVLFTVTGIYQNTNICIIH